MIQHFQERVTIEELGSVGIAWQRGVIRLQRVVKECGIHGAGVVFGKSRKMNQSITIKPNWQ